MQNFKMNSTIISIIFATLLASIVSSTLYIYLPKYGVSRDVEPPFKFHDSYKIGNLFIKDKKIEKKRVVKPKKVEKVYDLKKWQLQAVYISPSESFIQIQDKKDNEIISLLEEYKGYKLVDVKPEEAIFERAGKSYSLKLDEVKNGKKAPTSSVPPPPPTPTAEIENSVDPETNEISSASVKRKDIEFYMKNVSQIWRNIKIKPHRENSALTGFKVTWVKGGSVFEHLGLKRGDIISSIDGSPIKSFKQVQRYYKNIKKIKNLNLTVLRNGEEKEIDYEIQ